MKFLNVIFLLPLSTIGQIKYTGNVSDKNNLTKIPYATVALVKENIGINADENGYFTLMSFSSKKNDTLIISSVGYETLKIAINKISDDMKFELLEKQQLPNVFVTNKTKWINTILNRFGNCGTDYISAQDYTSQIAQYFHSDTTDYLLSEVEICKYSIAIIDPDRSIFRLRIYAMDSITGSPSIDITDSLIEVKSTERRVKINLEKYNIFISSHDFFVAIEWLKIPHNASREKTKINGNRMYYTDYSPLICRKILTRSYINNQLTPSEVWLKNYKGKWSPMAGTQRLMISTKIKY